MMEKLHLQKVHPRSQGWVRSATWQVQEFPGLILIKFKDESSWKMRPWIGAGISDRDQANQILRAYPMLSQDFPTRRDALRALEVTLWQNDHSSEAAPYRFSLGE